MHKTVNYGDGLGVLAYSKNGTYYRTGEPKRAFFLKGTGYEMGYMTSMLVPDQVHTLCTTFLDVLPLSLVAPAFVAKHNNSIVLHEVEELIKGWAEGLAFGVVACWRVGSLSKDGMRGSSVFPATCHRMLSSDPG